MKRILSLFHSLKSYIQRLIRFVFHRKTPQKLALVPTHQRHSYRRVMHGTYDKRRFQQKRRKEREARKMRDRNNKRN